jgi:hypothetical protein
LKPDDQGLPLLFVRIRVLTRAIQRERCDPPQMRFEISLSVFSIEHFYRMGASSHPLMVNRFAKIQQLTGADAALRDLVNLDPTIRQRRRWHRGVLRKGIVMLAAAG